MCDACWEPGDLDREILKDAIENAREQMGPRHLSSGPEPVEVARYVMGWHDALDYMAKRAGLE